MTRFLTAPVVYGLLALVLLLGSAAGVQTLRLARAEAATAHEQAAHSATKAQHAESARELAEMTAAVARSVRALEATYSAESAAAADKFQREKANAIAKKDRVIADLHAGALQLQPWWECETAGIAGDLADPAITATPSGDVGRAELRAASLAEGVQDGAVADSWIRWLQAELIATRKAVGASPQ